jgi:glycosyltransferase involved in cell wall biosynthesis
LFVGSLWYGPNAQGIEWLLKDVWPSVVLQVPSATLSLVGAAPSKVREMWQSHLGVFAPGYVDDIGQAYANADLVVVPVLCGAGSNIKVLEALAHNRPCLITQFCYGAFENDLVADTDVLVAKDAKDFIKKMVECLRDPVASAALAAHGHATVLTTFNESAFQATVRSAVGRALKQALQPE